jgi:hypothetical protein
MPPWTTLDAPQILEVQTATVGSGVVATFEEDGVRKVILAEVGDHYRRPPGAPPAFMIAGGFINLTRTPGSTLVPASDKPETPQTGLAREVEEEWKLPDGTPLLKVDPARCKPMDALTLRLRSGETRVVLGFALELTPEEVVAAKAHIARIETDPAYRAAAAAQSLNHDTGRPEVSGMKIFTLDELADGKVALLHQDQQSLFMAVRAHHAAAPAPRGRESALRIA